MDQRPEAVRFGRWRLGQQHRDSGPPSGGVHRVEERADVLHVVADVRHQRDVARDLLGDRRPAAIHRADVPNVIVRHRLGQNAAHGLGRLDGHDLARYQRQWQRIASAARANIEDRVRGLYQLAQRLERRLVTSPRIGAEHAGDRSIEVSRAGFAELLDLLAVGPHARSPGAQSVISRGVQRIDHSRHCSAT